MAASTRRGSLNQALADTIRRELAQAGESVSLIDLAEYPMPLYHAELETESGIPATVASLAGRPTAAESLVMVSPEYNGTFTPLLKNTIDRLTRIDTRILAQLTVLLASASPGRGGGARGLDVLPIATHALTFGGPLNMLNQADHSAVGTAALDAAKDAANRWIFPELVEEGLEPWAGTSDVYIMGSDQPTHGVDVTDHLEAGVASLQAHRAYIDGLGRDFDPAQFIQGLTAAQGEMLGVANGVVLGHISLAGM